jgi:hypothetical protein
VKNEIWFLRQESPMPLDLDAKQFIESFELLKWRGPELEERLTRITGCRESQQGKREHFFALNMRATIFSLVLCFVLMTGFVIINVIGH